jgi:uncharacterized protein YneF (UPF0154 family)
MDELKAIVLLATVFFGGVLLGSFINKKTQK